MARTAGPDTMPPRPSGGALMLGRRRLGWWLCRYLLAEVAGAALAVVAVAGPVVPCSALRDRWFPR